MKSYDHLNFTRASVVQFRMSQYIIGLNHTLESKVMPFEIINRFSCSISNVSIYHGPQSYTRVISYVVWIYQELLLFNFKCLDISWASIIHPSQKLCCLNSPRASVFNFERLDILFAWIGHPSDKLWPFEFHESFGCSILNVSIYHGSQSYTRVKSYAVWNY